METGPIRRFSALGDVGDVTGRGNETDATIPFRRMVNASTSIGPVSYDFIGKVRLSSVAYFFGISYFGDSECRTLNSS
jgi:hypothetical protein